MQTINIKNKYLNDAIKEFSKLASEFIEYKKCGKFSVEMIVFKGGFAGFKIKQEADFRN